MMKSEKSKLAQKITKRLIITEIIIGISIIILFYIFGFPLIVSTTLEKCDNTGMSISTQFENQITSMSNLVATASNTPQLRGLLYEYCNTQDETEKKELYAKINLLLNNLASNSTNINKIIIADIDTGTFFNSITEGGLLVIDNQEDTLIQQLGKSGNIWISPVKRFENGSKQLIFAKRLLLGNKYHIIAVYSDVTNLCNSVDLMAKGLFDEAVIYDMKGNAIYQIVESLEFDKKINMSETFYRFKIMTMNDRKYTTSIGANTFCAFAGYTSDQLMLSNTIPFIAFFLLYAAAMLLAVFFIFKPTISRGLKPLSYLRNSMTDIIKSGYNVDSVNRMQNRATADDEIGELSILYDNMIDTINDNTKQLVEHEIEKGKLNYALLVAQIDPHFIFNTMNIINSLARKHMDDEILTVNTSLMRLLKDKLKSSEDAMDTVEQEISITKEYIIITQIRTQMNVDFKFNYDSSLKTILIPKNILQPIIENSLIHGLYDIDTGMIEGKIEIDFYEKNQYLHIDIVDNGTGIQQKIINDFSSKDSPREIQKGQHIGLRNLYNRLKYLYPDVEDIMTISIIQPHGTKVSLKLPFSEMT